MGEINEMYSNHALLHAPYAHPHHVHPEISVGLCVDLQHEGAVSGEHSTSLSLSSGGLFRVFAFVHFVQDTVLDRNTVLVSTRHPRGAARRGAGEEVANGLMTSQCQGLICV